MLMFESHRLTNRFPIYRIMPELQGNLKNDDRTPIRFKREVCCGRRKDKALRELVTSILLKCYYCFYHCYQPTYKNKDCRQNTTFKRLQVAVIVECESKNSK